LRLADHAAQDDGIERETERCREQNGEQRADPIVS
jgi:hypothetical protein